MLQLITASLLLAASLLLPLQAYAATIRLPVTGQTKCYDTAGTEITCTGTGQDGDKQKGAALASPRFTDNLNGTATDNLTRLVWLKDTTCFGLQVIWATAITNANNLASGACGLTDSSTAGQWRLPNRKELQSLVDRSRSNLALPAGHPFMGVQGDYYWSSSTYAGNTVDAWLVGMYFGDVYNYSKSLFGYVWPVRGGQ